MFVQHRFELNERYQDHLYSLIPKFGYDGFGELVYYRTYSRMKKDGSQESWADNVIRVTNGTFSIRKDFYLKNHIPWDEQFWQAYAFKFAKAMFNMQWLPPGRGLWAMGSDFVYERGAMALYNCAMTLLTSDLADDISWLMDSLMHGVGVGFNPLRENLRLHNPQGQFDFIIPDSREGWCEATYLLLQAYLKPGQKKPYIIYDQVRPAGLPIKGFGGISSGPEPLMKLHKHIEMECETYSDPVLFKTNIANMVGCCVVAGNVRRSAEIACGSVRDPVFMDLKDYSKYPEREAFGWMSNNSVILETDDDFDLLGEVAHRVMQNGEPGIINKQNLRYGRIGKKNSGLRPDRACGFNPCGEIPLEHREVCNVDETLPTMCEDVDQWYEGCQYATFYCSTVSLLPTHQPSTNRVVARNRRIGVGLIDFSGWKHAHGVHKVTKWLRNGYKIVRETGKWLCGEAGIPEHIRVTCVKPGGTVPKLPGKTSGMGHPTHDFTLRRIRVQQNTSFHELLVRAGVPYEKDVASDLTDVFEYPILQGPAKPASRVTLWEQANNLVLLQREWADNAVSNTLYFKPKWKLIEHIEAPGAEEVVAQHIGHSALIGCVTHQKSSYVIPYQTKIEFKFENNGVEEAKIYEYDPTNEEDDIEPVLSSIAPLIKSLSLLPHSPEGVYKQMPEEGITKSEYEKRKNSLQSIDWEELNGSDGMDEKYCTGEHCEIK